jgi:hypothetical protein
MPSNTTPPRQFRLEPSVLADLDAIKHWLEQERGGKQTRTDAVRFAAREAAKKIQKKPKRGIDTVATAE